MADKKGKNEIPMPAKNPAQAKTMLASLRLDSGQKKITTNQMMIILEALAGSRDAALVARFAAVLAVFLQRGMHLNSQTLFSRHWENSPQRQNLEKLVLASVELFRRRDLEIPSHLSKIADALKRKYGDVFSDGSFHLSSGMRVASQDLDNALQGYTGAKLPLPAQPAAGPRADAQLNIYLDRLFSPRQKQLMFKKLNREAFSKTEREYYSRIVKKKLEAIADSQVRDIARVLTCR